MVERMRKPGWEAHMAGVITVPMFSHGVSGVYHYFGTRTEPKPTPSRMGRPPMQVVTMKQVHGTEVLIIGGREMGEGDGHDAVVTNRPGLLLAVRSADCVPILLMDTARPVVAAVHAGWRGTLGNIVTKTVMAMRTRFACSLRTIRAAVGPSIGACCYEVDEAVLAPLKRACPDWQEVVERAKGSRAYLDLRRLNRRQLEEAGLDPARIETVNLCTACHPELFYSYRRDGKATDHMTSGIGLTAVRG